VGLLEDLTNEQQRQRPGLPCSVAAALEELGPEDSADLRKALDDPSIFGTVIAKVLEDRGLHVPENTVQRHRRGACVCARG
jgi:glutamine synthetase